MKELRIFLELHAKKDDVDLFFAHASDSLITKLLESLSTTPEKANKKGSYAIKDVYFVYGFITASNHFLR